MSLGLGMPGLGLGMPVEDMYTALKMIADFKRSCNGKAKPMPPEIVPRRPLCSDFEM